MANSRKCCRHCKKYKPANEMITVPIGAFCDNSCRKEYGLNQNNKARLVSVGRKEVKKQFAVQKREHKLNDKSLRMREAVKAFNKFIRLRDGAEPCISCQRHHTGQYHAGHFKPAGVNSALKFDEKNVHKQCAPCNNNLSGNLTNYRIYLIEKIGPDEVERLENNKELKRYTCEELKEIETKYKAKAKQLEQDLAA